jgi:hypothetical protein
MHSLCRIHVAALAVVAAAAAAPSQAATVDWANWTSAGTQTVTGNAIDGSSTVGITFSGDYAFTQLNNTGFNYWQSPATPYLSASVSNAPANADIIGLGNAGTFTINFSQPVVNPLIGLVSWNGANVTFGGGSDAQAYNIQYLSSGCGYWGCGSYANASSTSFTGSGELHGVIELQGTYSSITFTDTVPEYWHGLTVGFEGIASTVPESGNLPLMLAGLGALGIALRRRAR